MSCWKLMSTLDYSHGNIATFLSNSEILVFQLVMLYQKEKETACVVYLSNSSIISNSLYKYQSQIMIQSECYRQLKGLNININSFPSIIRKKSIHNFDEHEIGINECSHLID